jgi:hypothetical protein
MVQMDLIDWLAGRTAQEAPGRPEAETPTAARRGVYDGAGKLVGVLTRVMGPVPAELAARFLAEHELLLRARG